MQLNSFVRYQKGTQPVENRKTHREHFLDWPVLRDSEEKPKTARERRAPSVRV